MDRSYLIPANSKKSLLLFGYFTWTDLIIFLTSSSVFSSHSENLIDECAIASLLNQSFLLMMFMPVDRFMIAILAITPGLICGFLVFPIPNYHNIRTVIRNAWIFYTTRQRYIWRGWCFDNGEGDKK